MAADDTIETLQKLADGFTMDVGRVRAALADEKTPESAKAILVGALNYVLDTWDMFPDHYAGLGIADDALVLRVAAQLAVAEGAAHRGLVQLAGEVKIARALLEDLVEPLKTFCAKLPEREVRGRKVAQILSSADVRAGFEGDLTRFMKKYEVAKVEPSPLGPAALVSEMRKMVKSALARAGLT